MSAGDPGSKAVYAQLLAARLAEKPIVVWAYNDQIWARSDGQYCRIEAVDFAD
jgi:hypothetical protein